MMISEVLLWLFMLSLLGILLLFLRVQAKFINNLPIISPSLKLNIGQPAPLFRETDQQGQAVTLSENHQSLLIFVKDTCGLCKELIKNIRYLEKEDTRIILVASVADNINAFKVPKSISIIQSNIVMKSYFVEQLPYIVLVDKNLLVKSMKSISNKNEIIPLLKKVI